MADVVDATGVELVDTAVEEPSIVKSEAVLLSELKEEPLTYRKYVGIPGTVVLSLAIFLISLYSYGFVNYDGLSCGMTLCPATIFFFVFALLHTLHFLYAVLRWKKRVKRRIKTLQYNNKKSKHFLKRLYKLYSKRFGLRGKYYLFKLYASEVLEKISQTYNFINIYTCTLPYWLTSLFCLLYVFESSTLSKTMWSKLFSSKKDFSTRDRDMQALQDVVLDLIYGVVPILVPYLSYGIGTNINEAILILMMPSISLFSKTRGLFTEALYRNLDDALVKREQQESSRAKRNRMSLYVPSRMEKDAKTQSLYFGKGFRVIMLLIGVVHTLFFLCVFGIHIAYGLNTKEIDNRCVLVYEDVAVERSIDDTNDSVNGTTKYANVWKNNGCKLKTPFCRSLFAATCNCAYLSKESVNLHVLPKNMVLEMHALKRLEIINCNLTRLQPDMEKLSLLFDVDLRYNALEEFQVDVQQWQYLTYLLLSYNRIDKYNATALWQHPNLVNLNLDNNANFTIPNDLHIHMRMLRRLDLRNNSMVLPNKFGRKEFPALIYLYIWQ